MDRIDGMKILLAVVEAGSLSAAARKLKSPLPSVSRKIADLERYLGTQLLMRTTRKIQLTEAGRDYVQAAREILARVEEAERRASGEYDEPRGELALTMPIEFGRLVVMPIAAEFLAQHPNISLAAFSTDRVMQLIEEQIDVAVRMGDLADSSLFALKVGDVDLLTVASPGYLSTRGVPADPIQLATHDAVVFGQFDFIWTKSGVADGQPRPRTRVKVNTASAAVAAALSGAGVTMALGFQVADHIRAGSLIRLLPHHPAPSLPVHLVYVKQGLMPLKVRAFLDFAAPRLRQSLTAFRELVTRPIQHAQSPTGPAGDGT